MPTQNPGPVSAPAVEAVADDGLLAVGLGTLAWLGTGIVALVLGVTGSRSHAWLVAVSAVGVLIGAIIGVFAWRRHVVYQAHRDSLAAQVDP